MSKCGSGVEMDTFLGAVFLMAANQGNKGNIAVVGVPGERGPGSYHMASATASKTSAKSFCAHPGSSSL